MDSLHTLRKKIVFSWRNLADNTLTKTGRQQAYEEVVNLSNEISKLDKSFSLDEKALEKYKQFAPAGINKEELNLKVNWAEYIQDQKLVSKDTNDLENEYNYFVATAVRIVSKRLPQESTQTDKFGTIVNATIANLIAMSRRKS